MLAGRRGLELVAQCRQRWGRDLAAVIVSGSDDTQQRALALAAGVPWLGKPVKPARLRATLMHLLTRMD